MELVLQPTSETCGQACIAMITGKAIEEVIKDMKTGGPISIGQLIEILNFYGVKHAERNIRISKKNPTPYPCSILTVHTHEKPNFSKASKNLPKKSRTIQGIFQKPL